VPTRTVAALVASAVLGVAVGVGVGLAVDSGGAKTFADPLGLGVPLAQQACSDREAVVVVATGNTTSALAAAVAENPDTRYLDVGRSCRTTWVTRPDVPRYVAYLGPYPTREACQVRMTPGHRGDLVTRLKEGSTEPVQCLCYLSYASMPVLRPGMETGRTEAVYVLSLQRLLQRLGRPALPHDDTSYDDRMVEAVKRTQEQVGLEPDGIVDADTWHLFQQFGCKLYPS